MLAEEVLRDILARLSEVKARGILTLLTPDRVLFELLMEALEERRKATWPNLVGYAESTPDYDGPVSDHEETQQPKSTNFLTSSGEDLTTAPTTADTTTQQTLTATPIGQGANYDLEANAVILALETCTTTSITALRIVHQTPTPTPVVPVSYTHLTLPTIYSV